MRLEKPLALRFGRLSEKQSEETEQIFRIVPMFQYIDMAIKACALGAFREGN